MRDNVKSGALTEVTFYILLSLYSPKHGYAVMQFIEEKTGGRLSLGAGTLYGALNSMLEKGWIELFGDSEGRKKEIDDNMVFDIDNLKGFLNDTSSFGFIAKENNKIIGFAYCYTLLRPDGKTMFYLHSIGMLPNYQDKGYGSKLLSFIKEYSKEIGCSEMFLITDKGNPRACHVYEKLGGKNDYKDEIVYVYDYEKGDK